MVYIVVSGSFSVALQWPDSRSHARQSASAGTVSDRRGLDSHRPVFRSTTHGHCGHASHFAGPWCVGFGGWQQLAGAAPAGRLVIPFPDQACALPASLYTSKFFASPSRLVGQGDKGSDRRPSIALHHTSHESGCLLMATPMMYAKIKMATSAAMARVLAVLPRLMAMAPTPI